MSDYCHTLKNLADCLADVDAPVSENALVLQLIRGLPQDLRSQVNFLQYQVPLPSFIETRSALLLLEGQQNDLDDTNTGGTALFSSGQSFGSQRVAASEGSGSDTSHAPQGSGGRNTGGGRGPFSGGRGNFSGGRGRSQRGRGRGYRGGAGSNSRTPFSFAPWMSSYPGILGILLPLKPKLKPFV
ncbi:unnamed protein product [Cuscuta campestris]|uniref:Uncharacterized protein n=1 Tax=Cuscuta campestris TaxID=132261 RepID=A0A484KDX4_9ASTE|nr:unnamed protein product [Cuscuta campestris]